MLIGLGLGETLTHAIGDVSDYLAAAPNNSPPSASSLWACSSPAQEIIS